MSLFLDDAPYPSVPMKALSNSLGIADAPERFGVCIVGASASIEIASQFLNKVVATHFNGAPHQLEGANFWPLAGRNVFISSCVEHESEISIQNLARKVWSAGAKNVFYLDLQITADFDILDGVPQRHSRSEIIKVGWSDIVKGGWQPRTYVELYKSNASAKRSIPRSGEFDTSTTEQKALPEPCDTDDEFTVELFGSFIRTDAGIEKTVRTYGKTKESSKSSDVFVCSNLEIIGKANIDGLHQWGTVVKFAAHDGSFQTIIVPDADLMGDGLPAREKLGAGGLKISTARDARGFFSELILFHPCSTFYEIAPQFGWKRGSFVTAGGVIEPPLAGDNERRIIMDSANIVTHRFATAGDYEAWKQLAALAEGNPMMLLGLACAFAGPLILPLRQESGGIHIHGKSSRGKTTLLSLLGTVWGDGGDDGFVRSWHGTKNGAESVAYIHNDCCLVLDELGQGDSDIIQGLIYLFGNGQGKNRSTQKGLLEKAQSCRAFVVSSGEESIASKLRGKSRNGLEREHMAGASMRMIDMSAEVGDDTGLFENLHGYENSAAFVEEIKHQICEHYGHAGIDFIQQLVSDLPAHVAFCKAEMKRFLVEVTEEDDDPQTARRAKRFALIAASGSLAEKMGILPFPVGTCHDGVKECFRRWQVDQMPKSSKEEVDVIERAKRFISKNSDTRFDRIVPGNSRTVAPGIEQEQVEILNLPKFERAGYFKEDDDGTRTYMMLPQVFETEVCGSLTASSAGRILLKNGYLIPGEGTRMARNVHVPNLAGSMRMYVIKSSILSADD